MARVMFKDIQEIVKATGFSIDKHSNKKAKHYIVTKPDSTSVDVYFAGKLADMLTAIQEGVETFVSNHTLDVAQAQSKRAVKAAKAELDDKISDLMVKCMKIGIDKTSDSYKAMRKELMELRALRGDDLRSRVQKTAEAKVAIEERKSAKKASRKRVTKRKA